MLLFIELNQRNININQICDQFHEIYNMKFYCGIELLHVLAFLNNK